MESGPETMKRLILALIMISGAMFAQTPTPITIPTPIDVSKIDFSKLDPKDIEATERHRDELRGVVNQKHEEQAQVISSQGSSISDIQKAAEETKDAFDLYKNATEASIKRGNEAIAAYDYVNKKNHRAQIVLCALWIALVGLVITKVPLVAKQYALYGGIVAIIAGCGFIFLWL